MSEKKKMHLLGFAMHGVMNHMISTWAHPRDKVCFAIASTYTPGSFQEFVDLIVPELQRRGRFRKEYTGNTLRHHLNEY